MCGSKAVAVEQGDRVCEQIASGVARTSGLIGRRSASAALVVADHEPAVPGEHSAEPVLPPQHRASDTHHEDDRRICRVTERLGAELDPIHIDQSLGDYHPRWSRPLRLHNRLPGSAHSQSERKVGRSLDRLPLQATVPHTDDAPDGSDPHELATGHGNDLKSPAWSHGGKLAYLEQNENGNKPVLVEINGKTGRRVRLPFAQALDITWSPDGSHLAITARKLPTGPFELYSITVDGHNVERLTNNLDTLGADWGR